MRSDATQRLLLEAIAWRAGFGDAPSPEVPLAQLARSRLRRWQRRIVAGCRAFDELDAAALHALRKRVKRQRYAVEFLAPLLPKRRADRQLKALAAAQQALGVLNDVLVAREHYQARVAQDPAAWFAVGWLSAQLDAVRAAARARLARLAAEKLLPAD
jgi:triphosphatase